MQRSAHDPFAPKPRRTVLSVEDVPEGAADVVAWVGDDEQRARYALRVELDRPESRRRASVLDHANGLLGLGG